MKRDFAVGYVIIIVIRLFDFFVTFVSALK